MILYPTIELQNRKPVSLFRGKMEEPQIWHVDPIAKARDFAQAGAGWIHVTDFDAVMGADNTNQDIIEQLIKETPASVQVGGGIRSIAQIETWLNAGAARVVIGTAATTMPDLVKEAAKLYPDQIVLAVDVLEGSVVTHGWKEKTAYQAIDYVNFFANDPLAAILITDIDADLELSEDSLGLITQIAAQSNTPVLARGLTRNLDDISRIKFVPHVAGCLVGRALFDRSIDISDALAIAAQETGVTAQFQ